MPVASQATPVASPLQIQSASDSHIVDVNNKKKSRNWRARHCAISNDVKCRRDYTRSYRHRHYHEPYYGHYRPYRHNKPGVTIRID
jgi:hypothetical protein